MDCYYFSWLAPSLCSLRAIRKISNNLIGGTAVPRPDHPFRSLKKLHETQLNDFEAMFQSGVALAVPAAAHYCAEHGLVAPAWLTKTSAELFCTILRFDTDNRAVCLLYTSDAADDLLCVD